MEVDERIDYVVHRSTSIVPNEEKEYEDGEPSKKEYEDGEPSKKIPLKDALIAFQSLFLNRMICPS